MMTASETDTEDFDSKATDNSAILEISTMSTSGITKQESRDPDLSNYSTSVEGSVVSFQP